MKSRNLRWVFALVFLVVAFGGLSASLAKDKEAKEPGVAPAWISGDVGEQYPATQYLAAVGTGKSLKSAKKDAQEAIAAVFASEVKSVHKKKSQTTLTTDTDDKTKGEDSEQTESDVEVTTHVKLRGVEIKETYEDKASKQFYALAILNKLKARNLYMTRAEELKQKIAAQKERFDEKPSHASLDKMEPLLKEFDQVTLEATVLGPLLPVKRPVSPEEFERMKAKVDDALSKNRIYLDYSGDEEEFSDLVESCMTERGVVVITDPDMKKDAVYTMTLKLATKDLKIKVEGWSRVQYRASADVRKGANRVQKVSEVRTQDCREREQCFEKIKESLGQAVCEKAVVGLEK